VKTIKLAVVLATLFAAALTVPSRAYGQQDSVWIRTDQLKPFERRFFKEAGAPLPASIKRYFRHHPIGEHIENFENDAVYNSDDGLVDDSYQYVTVRFRGDETNFALEYSHSVGRALSSSGSLWVDGGTRILTDITSSTQGSTLTITRNGVVVLKRRNGR
jgi:hypothetical protein